MRNNLVNQKMINHKHIYRINLMMIYKFMNKMILILYNNFQDNKVNKKILNKKIKFRINDIKIIKLSIKA